MCSKVPNFNKVNQLDWRKIIIHLDFFLSLAIFALNLILPLHIAIPTYLLSSYPSSKFEKLV